MTSLYYPHAALLGFADGVASQLKVKIKLATGSPSTNGSTVYLTAPSHPLNAAEFREWCGVAIHEAAHCHLGSPARHYKYGQGNKLRLSCYNTVVDVADETRIENTVMTGARKFLSAHNVAPFKRIITEHADPAAKVEPVWLVQCFAILHCRVDANIAQALRRTFRKHPLWPKMSKAANICRRVMWRGSHGPERLPKEWARISRAATDLVKLLSDLAAPEEKALVGLVEGVPTGSAPAPAGAVLVTMEEGQALALGKPVPVAPGATKAPAPPRPPPPDFDEDIYRRIRPGLAAVMARLAEAREADGGRGGFDSGPMLGRDLSRVYTDGKAFARRLDEGESIRVAVCLDVSGSMVNENTGVNRLAPTAAVAQAFADTAATVADQVSMCVFGRESAAVRTFRGMNDPPVDSGDTMTAEALAWARTVLAGRGNRCVIVLTDGSASFKSPVEDACAALVSAGIRVLVIGLDIEPEVLSKRMPGARVAGSKSAEELLIHLRRITERVFAA